MRAQVQGAVGEEGDGSATLVVGLGHELEVGASVYNLSFERRDGRVRLAKNADDLDDPYAPLALGTAQKLFELSASWRTALGGQLGTNVAHADELALVARGYVLVLLELGERLRCTLGPYVATRALLGNRQIAGGFTGCSVEIVQRRFGLQADWDAGAHALGVLSIGPRVHVERHVALSAAAQIPNAWGTGDYRGVLQIEITYPGRQD